MNGLPGSLDMQQVMGAQDSVHDLRSLNRLRTLGREDPDAGLRAAAKQFESVFTQMLMKSMREANEVFEENDLFSSQDGEFYQQMHDEQLAVTLSNRQSLGLADLMVAQLKGKPLPAKHAAVASAGMQGPSSAAPAAAVTTRAEKAVSTWPDEAFCAAKLPAVKSESPSLLAIFQTPSAPLAVSASPSSLRVAATPEQKAAETPLAFVSRLLPHAEKAARQLGTSAPVLIAQAALESGWGRSALADPQQQGANNLFGVKADAEWSGAKVGKRTLEYNDGKPGWQQAWFRAYENVGEAFNDYVQFVKGSPRYESAIRTGQDPKAYLQGLSKGGYATDPQYVQKVVGILESDRFGDLLKQARELLGNVQAWSSHHP